MYGRFVALGTIMGVICGVLLIVIFPNLFFIQLASYSSFQPQELMPNLTLGGSTAGIGTFIPLLGGIFGAICGGLYVRIFRKSTQR